MGTSFTKSAITLSTIPLLLACSSEANESLPKLDDVFGDHMVLQRDKPVKLRGSASPNQVFEVQLGGQSQTISANKDAKWQASFQPISENDPINIKIDGTVVANDILIGDVFLCSGQSNMEYPVRRALNPDREINTEHSQDIRLLTIPKATSPSPKLNFSSPEPWVIASPETVKDFSAVCYFTAKELKKSGIGPIGLIDSSWGGTRIESWMSSNALRASGQRLNDLELLDIYAKDPVKGLNRFSKKWENWWHSENPDSPAIWQSPKSYNWSPVPAFENWKIWGDPSLENYNGQVWYQSTISLSKEQTTANQIHLGSIDELDSVWINGQFIGSQFNWGGQRQYEIPPSVLKSGENEIIVNVLSAWDKGGLFGPAEAMRLSMADGASLPLIQWQYLKAKKHGMNSPKAPWESVTGITGIGNSMISPLQNIGLKGVLWYQGESNAGDNATYGTYLSKLILDWQNIVSADVKALIFQLPEFGSQSNNPAESGWANIREAQRQVTASSANAALVVTLGAGDMYDIHPPNKQEVARRAADAAIALFYEKDVPDTNRDPVKSVLSEGYVMTTLSGENRDLKTWSSNSVIGVELCEGNTCYYAETKTNGSTLITSVPNRITPDRLRYNWADTPRGNLADESDRPVGPFEIKVSHGY